MLSRLSFLITSLINCLHILSRASSAEVKKSNVNGVGVLDRGKIGGATMTPPLDREVVV